MVRRGIVLAALLGGALIGGSIVALIEIGATLGELRCRLSQALQEPTDGG